MIASIRLFAIDLNLRFTGNDTDGNNSTIDSVVVVNTRTGDSITLRGTTELAIQNVVSSVSQPLSLYETIQITPNGTNSQKLTFNSTNSGKALIQVFGIDGKAILNSNNFLDAGINSFQITLPNGIFVVKVTGNGYQYSTKTINMFPNRSRADIQHIGNATATTQNQPQKVRNSTLATFVNEIKVGDNFMYRATDKDGNIAIVMDKISGNKNINFRFFVCKDGSGINYPTVKIGSQVWMAQNLATTKYNDGTAIENVTDSMSWLDKTEGAYCFYRNNIFNYLMHGALYNFYAVETGKLAPKGWHVPKKTEWKILFNNYSVEKLRSTLTWNNSINATNETGFSATAGGVLFTFGIVREISYMSLGTNFGAWTQDIYIIDYDYNAFQAYVVDIRLNDYLIGGLHKKNGLSVRCIKDLSPPEVSTGAATNVTATTATVAGNVKPDEIGQVNARGICWSTDTEPTITKSNKTTVSGTTGDFTSSLTNLLPFTKYYIRAYATNDAGTSYGEILSFTTAPLPPVLSQTTSKNVTATSALISTQLTPDGSEITARGFCWNTSPNPTTALSTKSFESTNLTNFERNITGLTPNTKYYVRAFATNSAGTGYSNEISFTTLSGLPTVSTKAISDITTNSAISGGNVTSTGEAAITQRGICWSTSPNPTISLSTKTTEDGTTGEFSSTMTELESSTDYYVRAYATNSYGTAYGDTVKFTTAEIVGPPTDKDGNVYTTITIGTQTWMVENLKTTKYNDGTPIANPSDWSALESGAYCWYFDDIYNKNSYGALYNWHAVNSGKLAPKGWRVATEADWNTLIQFLGGEAVAGEKMKDLNTNSFWDVDSNPASNSSGFKALGSGSRKGNEFYDNGKSAIWWTNTISTEITDPPSAQTKSVYYKSDAVSSFAEDQKYGFSVRCIKN